MKEQRDRDRVTENIYDGVNSTLIGNTTGCSMAVVTILCWNCNHDVKQLTPQR